MKRPHWFRWIDLASLVGLSILSGVATVYAMLVGAEPKTGIVLLWVVTLVFFAIWARFAYARKQWLDKFLWAPKWGFMIHPGGYKVDVSIVDDLAGHTVRAWASAFDQKKIEDVMRQAPKWVWFVHDLVEEPQRATGSRKLKGYVIPNGFDMAIDYDAPDQPLIQTAFERELGHLIQGHITGTWNEIEHHERAKRYGLK